MILNSRHILSFDRALDLIFAPAATTHHIKQGEALLQQQRLHPSYPFLLCEQLALPHRDQKKLFVLLELRKMVPLRNDSAWWHLIELYYSCSELLAAQVVEIVGKQLQHSLKDQESAQPDVSFVSFFREPLASNFFGFMHISRMLLLGSRLVKVIQAAQQAGFANSSQEQKWKLVCSFLSESICKLFQREQSASPNLTESIITLALFLSGLLESAGDSHQSTMMQQFLRSALLPSSQASLSVLSTFLLYPECDHLEKETQAMLQKAISRLLTESTKNHSTVNLLQIKHLLLNWRLSKNNSHLLRKHWSIVLNEYYHYLSHRAALPSNWDTIILDIQLLDSSFNKREAYRMEEEEAEGEEQAKEASCDEKDHKLDALIECIRVCSDRMEELLVWESQISVIVVAALAGRGFQPWGRSCEIISAFLQKCLHHKTQQPEQTLLFCLLFAWRFFPRHPTIPGLLEFCYCLLDIRMAFKDLQNICDQVLAALMPSLLTILDAGEVWSFADSLISVIENNEMDRTAQSYYPIILIVESLDNFTDVFRESHNMLRLFSNLIDHLIQEQLNEDNSSSGFTNFDLFYRLASVVNRFIEQACQSERGSQVWDTQNRELVAILASIQKYVFRNALYSPETGLLYAYHLLATPDTSQDDILNNMLQPAFWSGFDIDDCSFYSTIVFKLCLHRQLPISPRQVQAKVQTCLKMCLEDLLGGRRWEERAGVVVKFEQKVRECERALFMEGSDSPFWGVLQELARIKQM